jgi:hypothetical protein
MEVGGVLERNLKLLRFCRRLGDVVSSRQSLAPNASQKKKKKKSLKKKKVFYESERETTKLEPNSGRQLRLRVGLLRLWREGLSVREGARRGRDSHTLSTNGDNAKSQANDRWDECLRGGGR